MSRTALALVCVSTLAFGQTGPDPSNPQQISKAIRYRLFFLEVTILEDLAKQYENTGKKDEAIEGRNNFYIKRLGVTAAEADGLRALAKDFDRAMKASAAKAGPIITSFHAKYPPGQPIPGGVLPPPPPELHQLDLEENEFIKALADRLRLELGESVKNKIEIHLKNQSIFTRNISNSTGATGVSGVPAGQPPPTSTDPKAGLPPHNPKAGLPLQAKPVPLGRKDGEN